MLRFTSSSSSSSFSSSSSPSSSSSTFFLYFFLFVFLATLCSLYCLRSPRIVVPGLRQNCELIFNTT
eukprot:5267977-Amphidinium_carterae.1